MTATFMNAFNEVFAFCPCLKEAWGCTPPLVEYIAIVEPASIQIWEMWQLGRDTIIYPPIGDGSGPGRSVKGI